MDRKNDMEKAKHELIVIGGGPAGLAAAIGAREEGIEDILILERDKELGGILNQCIHNGFGLHTFKEELTGPEYASRFAQKVIEMKIPFAIDTTVLDVATLPNGNKEVVSVGKDSGLVRHQAQAVILAMGCRERPRGALNIPGKRPAGIYSAGSAQRLVNMEGVMPGKNVVILGSGDIGLIMARRMTLEGANVKLVAEVMPFSGGLKRNIVQCLDDFGIPLKLSHTVTQIHGTERLEGVTISQVDASLKPIPGTEEYIPCDTLLLSVGLIPENELTQNLGASMDGITKGPVVSDSLETSIPGIFACGNVLHVHDLVDFVSEEAMRAGKNAAKYIKGLEKWESASVIVNAKKGVRYTVPQLISPTPTEDLIIRFRVGGIFKNGAIVVKVNGTEVFRKKKRIMAPGEMETVALTQDKLKALMPIQSLEVFTE